MQSDIQEAEDQLQTGSNHLKKIEIGKGVQLSKGKDLAILSVGTIAENVSEAIKKTTRINPVTQYDMRFIKPLDEKLLNDIFQTYDTVITIEDGAVKGGFGSAILEFAAEYNYKNKIIVLGIKDEFIDQGSIEELQIKCEIDIDSLSEIISNN